MEKSEYKDFEQTTYFKIFDEYEITRKNINITLLFLSSLVTFMVSIQEVNLFFKMFIIVLSALFFYKILFLDVEFYYVTDIKEMSDLTIINNKNLSCIDKFYVKVKNYTKYYLLGIFISSLLYIVIVSNLNICFD